MYFFKLLRLVCPPKPIVALVLIGVLLLLWHAPVQTRSGSITQILAQSWVFFKQRHLVQDQRVESNHYGGTISEGQSYAMLHAVWMNDPKTFAQVWQWTREHLQQRQTDHLFAWRWGKRQDGTMGVISPFFATDADEDIAYALLLAGERWGNPQYIKNAKAIIQDLWAHAVQRIQGRYYLAPGDAPHFYEEFLTVDPSYFAPYIYRKFASYDPAHAAGWRQLAQDSYATLEACSNLSQTGLPPNWCGIRWDTGAAVFSDKQGPGSRNFSYDAFRVFWRMGLDAALGSAEAKDYLRRHTKLVDDWEKHQTLPEGFTPEGAPLGPQPSGFALSAAMVQYAVLHPDQSAESVYQTFLAPHYHPEGYWWNTYNNYLHSVLWFHLQALSRLNPGQQASGQ